MEKKEFQRLAVRTESIVDEIVIPEASRFVFMELLNAYAIIGDALDKYKKNIFYGRDIDTEAMDREIGMDVTLSLVNVSRTLKAMSEGQLPLDMTPTRVDIDPRVFHAILGTITEHAEVAEALHTGLETGDLDLVNMCEEFGDSDWYKALFYEATGISWDDVQEMIIKKLEVRYADKIFSDGEANERDLPAERALLEESIKTAVETYEREHG